MSPRFLQFSTLPRLFLGTVCAIALAGCGTPKPVVGNEPQQFDQAIAAATDSLFRQSQEAAGFMARRNKQAVVLDPTLDAASGQQTAATQMLDRTITERVPRNFEQIEVLPFQTTSLAKAQYLLVGTLVRAQATYRINLALIDIKAGSVVAQSSAVARKDGVDMSPLPYYRDSPVLIKDKVTDGYVRTSSMPTGQKADATYMERIATAAVINDATVLYNSARYREALGQYRSALATPAGDQIRVLTGIYLSVSKLGQVAEAEETFGRLVAYGIATNQLGVKFLFNPGSTEFWADPQVSGAYGMWLRQIARQASRTKVCMDIVGHTSKTGAEDANETLSLRRATFIKQRLSADSADVARRTRPVGMGSKQNIVGSGTDDVVDAPDRRVEFSIVECGK
ncbi:MAG: flagellar motor protein MotB [Variovorax sp.]|nr:flagellar motor protein MotB [Variovorax sp.]